MNHDCFHYANNEFWYYWSSYKGCVDSSQCAFACQRVSAGCVRYSYKERRKKKKKKHSIRGWGGSFVVEEREVKLK